MDVNSLINLEALTVVHSIASMLMWLKLLYFMRIFKDTGKFDNADMFLG